MRKINNIKLFVNDDEKSQEVAKKLQEELLKYDFHLVDDAYDLVISIGGDGSFLHMVREENFNDNIYYVGINAGTLGFLQEIDIDKTDDFVQRLNNNDFKEEDLSFEETKILTKNSEEVFYSLNEIVVRKEDFSLLKVSVYVDDELLENFTGDGLLISTSTGSTAYNMSFGGAIIYNTLKALSITPIAPINNKAYKTLVNPVIIPDDKIIKLKPQANLFLMIDGKIMTFDNVLELTTKVSNRKIKCLRMQGFHFIKTINQKRNF